MRSKKLSIAFGVLAMLVCVATAQTRTQTISLEKGWNAVWLEVQPTNAAPAALFAGTSVDIAAAYTLPATEAQFVKNTAVNVQTLAGWNVWYAPYRADAPLTRLEWLAANTGYLLHALEAATLTVRGEVQAARVRWTPNRFNFVGFPVAEAGAPTFKQFFQGSPTHSHNKIYRLVNGAWRQVLQPDAETLRAGEAFWIYSAGASDYQGPLSVTANTSDGLVLHDAAKGNIEFRNATTHPLAFSLEQVAADGNAALPLAAVLRVAVSNAIGTVDAPVAFPDGAWVQDFPAFDAGGGMTLPLVLRVRDMQPGSYRGLLKVTTDLGTETWVPVRATREQ
ncbi:MAG TPA: hypothetical protein P5026_10005 [Kiritimatiellia bacterium]|nr:hypothetical protein [Kiritimatiellia bacterium]HRU70755.1 hypothetical protein [Kiritimatiellia bacterium]